MPSHIELSWLPNERGARRLHIRIDGEDFVEMVRRAEAASAADDGQDDLAGAYVGFDDRVASPHDHLMGTPDPLFDHDGRTEILVCAGCREPGCWPLLVDVQVDHDRVRWTGFSQPHRPHWDHSSLGTPTFSRTEYETAVRRLERGSRPRGARP